MRISILVTIGLLISGSAVAQNVIGDCNQEQVIKFVDAGYNKKEIAELCGTQVKRLEKPNPAIKAYQGPRARLPRAAD